MMHIGFTLVRIAAVYLFGGLVIGLGMGIAGNFALTSVHTHALLLGWATMALAGIIYIVMPGCSRSRLAKLHFWGHNIGLPLMIASLSLMAYGESVAEKAIAASSILVLASLGLFAINVVKNGRLEYKS
jgi:cbb3-type cytochrome oxidase subunit 1